MIVSLLFVLIWEGLLGNLLSGVAWLSVAQWGLRIGHEVSAELPDPTNLPWAVPASVVVTVGGVCSPATGCGRSRSAARTRVSTPLDHRAALGSAAWTCP